MVREPGSPTKWQGEQAAKRAAYEASRVIWRLAVQTWLKAGRP